MAEVLFLNHYKTQCGIHELGKRIFGLLDQSIMPCVYREVPPDGLADYIQAVAEVQPTHIIYNYYPSTMAFLNQQAIGVFPHIKHLGVIHDPLDPGFIDWVNTLFEAWIIHDPTNPLPIARKFKTVRPIPRFERTAEIPERLSIGSHGFNVSPWKQFDKIIQFIQDEFDEVDINMNITNATFGPPGQLNPIEQWKQMIHKPGVKLNITSEYLPEEKDVIEFLSRNTMNVYFYNAPGPYVGVGASGDLAVASQSSLAVNDTYMYRHFHERLGYYQGSMAPFINNRADVRALYEEWNPTVMSEDYKKMVESV